MQEQKIIPELYLVLQNNYNNIELAIFNKNQLVIKNIIDKHESSKNLVPQLDKILKQEKLNLKNFNFLGVNKGPGPFTTLRVTIATANALNFAADLPLVSINGLEALIKEYKNPEYSTTIALLNAYNNDVYFAIQNHEQKIEIGYQNIDKLLNFLEEKNSGHYIQFIGNGVDLFLDKIRDKFKNLAFIPSSIPQTCSIEQIGKMAYESWQKKENISKQITPLYLKEAIK